MVFHFRNGSDETAEAARRAREDDIESIESIVMAVFVHASALEPGKSEKSSGRSSASSGGPMPHEIPWFTRVEDATACP